ncbi:PKD domain-containing protein [Mycobacterium sp. PS03-16]|uniref:PQQ-dependent sugar dehydrogenase n=1 Tax=Mycobacterium sp. PS03-16 TaxID=2559611 RepID=UPI001073CA6C|nr:PQQ-dependent sugar dehydrogenase [Mycobacterium sp. PS03-16]TFV61462.1 PKD domain-containing protein [Mycobacterium sp. PS03-16]
MPVNRGKATSYARYIGRVGALAVALGVGGAVATTPGVAWADDTPSASASADTAASESASESTSEPTRDDGATTAPQGQEPSADEDEETTADDELPDEDLDDEIAEPVDETDESPEPAEVPIEQPGEEPEDEADPVDEIPAEGDGGDPLDPAAPAAEQSDAPRQEPVDSGAPVDTDEVSTPEPAGEPATPAASEEGIPAQRMSSTADASLMSGARVQVAGLPAPRFALPTPAEVYQSVRPTVVACLCGVIDFIDTVVKPLFGGFTGGGGGGGGAAAPAGPATPLGNPMVLAVMAWVRREATMAINAFIASPLGAPIRFVINAVDDFGDSPQGRAFSQEINALLGECGPSADLSADFDRTTIVSGLTEPTDFKILTKHHSSNVDRIFIVEKAGAIKMYNPTSGAVTTLTTLATTTGGERGLAGIEIHPDFWHEGTDGYRSIYVAYTSDRNFDTLARLTLSEDMTTVVGAPRVIIESTESANNFHHGGDLAFDNDGRYLYWAVGDNTEGVKNAQNLANIHGKVLRLNADGSVPVDNPFADDDPLTATPRDYIYAYGLRNPFRLTVTPTNQLLAADVGEANWEELNLITAGGNYGWPGAEGNCTGCASVNPIYTYRHSGPPANAGAITGVTVFTGDAFGEEYRNTVFVADYSLNWIRVVKFDEEYSSLISSRTFWGNAGSTVNLTQGPDGHLYQLTIYPGELSVISPSGGNRGPTAVLDASQTSTDATSLTVDFSGLQSTDPDGDTLSYRWDFGDGDTSTAAAPTKTFTTSGAYSTYTVTLTVSDGEKISRATQTVTVGSTPPVAVIDSIPTHYNAGDTITFTGRGSDAQDGASLPDSAYEWTVVFHHNDHTHPFASEVTGPEATITIPRSRDQLDSTWYRVHLTVTDSSGLSTTVYKDIKPNLVDLTITTDTPGATFTIDGLPHRGTYTERAVVGVDYVVSAPTTQVINGQTVTFDGWSDGGAPTHTIRVPNSNAVYTVNYSQENALLV